MTPSSSGSPSPLLSSAPRGAAIRMAEQSGFSLIEVVLAVGVVSFSMLTIIGMLGVGLTTAHNAENQEAIANIVNELRGQLQQSSFTTAGGITLSKTTYYYSTDGIETTAANNDIYYQASLAAYTVSPTGSAGSVPVADASFAENNAQCVTVTISYPQSAPPANQLKTVFSVFIANQTGNSSPPGP